MPSNPLGGRNCSRQGTDSPLWRRFLPLCLQRRCELQSPIQVYIISLVTKNKFPFPKGTGRVFYGWWIIVLGSLIVAVGSGIFAHGFTVFFLPLKRDLVASSAAISLLYGAARLEGGAEGPFVGYFIDRFGPRVMILIGAGFAGIGLLVLSLVKSYWGFFFIYIFVVSLGYNMGFFHPVYAAVNSWFIRRRGFGFAIISAAGNVGGIFLPPILSYLILSFGWRTGAAIAGLLMLAVCLPLACFIHRSPETLGLIPDGEPLPAGPRGNLTALSSGVTGKDYTVREGLRTLRFWLLMSGITSRLMVTVALSAHLVPIAVWKGMDEATGAYLVSLLAVSTMSAALVMGWMGDRRNKIMISSLGILPTVGGLVALVVSEGPVALHVFPVALAVTLGTAPLNWSLIGDFFGRKSYGTLRGMMGLGYGFFTFFSPIYAGWMHDRTGSYASVLLLFCGILLLSSILFLFLQYPSFQRRQKSPLNP